MPASRLCVLNVAYPLAPVGRDAVGGAEQVLATLDAAIAAEGSTTAGELIPIATAPATLDQPARAGAQRATAQAIEQALTRYPIDLIHFHGVDFDAYLPPDSPPALVTLHLPPFAYAPTAFQLWRPHTYLQCVSTTQQATLPPTVLPVVDTIANGVALDEFHAATR